MLHKSSFDILAEALSLDLSSEFIEKKMDCAVDYLLLRKKQNQAWAFQQAVEGIELAKSGDFQKAFKKYNTALELDPSCVEALVGRGCAYANERKYKLAVEDLEEALDIDPNHKNAHAYLNEILATQKKRKQERRKSEKLIKSGEFILPYSSAKPFN